MKQAYNPFLPSYEYIPDGEPYVFEDRIYIYGSHDQFAGKQFCANDYVCWSAPVTDLSDWKYEGVIYRKDQDPMNPDGSHCLYAPDLQKGLDGRYYLYYALDMLGMVSVAVCDSPCGAFSYYGTVMYANGSNVGAEKEDIFQFDPGVFIDDDGRIFLYSGFAPQVDDDTRQQMFGGRRIEGAYCMELEKDMLTVKAEPKVIIPGAGYAQGTEFEPHAFFEASSMRKIRRQYYFIYSSAHGHELCYAVSDKPDGDFSYGGTIVSNGDVFYEGRSMEQALNYTGNNHGSIVEINEQFFIFYHRQTNRHSFSRQACAEPVRICLDGYIPQVEMTSCGLNLAPLRGIGKYEARIACNLMSKDGAAFYSGTCEGPVVAKSHPYFTQSGADREGNGDQYIANMQDGSTAGFKYFTPENVNKISVRIRGNGSGCMRISTIQVAIGEEMREAAFVPVSPSSEFYWSASSFCVPDAPFSLHFSYEGNGEIDFTAFEFSKEIE